MKNTTEAQAAMLLLAMLAALPAAAAAAAPPTCTISGPVVNVSPGVLDINSTVSRIYQLSAGNYTLPDTVTIAQGTTICVKGAGRDVTLIGCTQLNKRHMDIKDNATLHLEGLTLTSGATTCGGLTGSATSGSPVAPSLLTSNSLRIIRSERGVYVFGELFTAVMHDTEILEQSSVLLASGGAIFARSASNRAINVKLTGTTTITRNVALTRGGAIYLFGEAGPVRLSLDGTTTLRENEARHGGAAYLEGDVGLTVQGPSLMMTGNRAIGQGGLGNARGGAIAIVTPTVASVPLTTVELASAITTFSGNVADPTTGATTATAEGAAIYVNVVNSTAVLNFLGPVVFSNNIARPSGAGFGGTVHLEATATGVATINAAACVTFEGNTVEPYVSGIAYRGAALGLANGAATDGSSERVNVSPAGKLLFGSNTIGTSQADVSIAAEGAVVCSTSSGNHGPGDYTIACDMCAASCTAVAGGDCACGIGNTMSCAGCPAPPPTGGNTLITGYSSCTNAASAGSYPADTRCTPTCSPGSSGGLAICGQTGPAAATSWQVTPCVAGCNGTPVAVPGVVWQCSGAAAGGACGGVCSTAAGFAGGPVTAICGGPLWSNTTTGSCTRVACIGNPPGSPANATFQCPPSTPVGQACKATCGPGLSGGQSSMCQPDGSWGALTGDGCVNCDAGKPRLEVMGPPASVPQGTTTISATFTFTAPYVTGATTLAATMDGVTPCTAQPPQLTGPQVPGTQITVVCQISTGISASLLRAITLTATYTGSNGCSSGSLSAQATVNVFPPPTAAPTVLLSAGGAAPSACKAAAGKPTTAVAVFSYAVTPAAGSSGLVLADPVVSASAPQASCTSARTGTLLAGQLTVSCSGVFDSLASLTVYATLNATTPGSLVGSATSSEAITFVCCTSSGGGGGGGTPAGTIARAVGTSSGDCLNCGGSPAAVEAVWLRGQLDAGVMQSGAVSAATCSSTGAAVGTISTVCENGRLLRVKVVNPPGTAANKLQYLTRCDPLVAPSGAPCLEPNSPNTAAYAWRTALPGRDAFKVTTMPQGVIHEFAILQTSTDPNCECSRFFYAIRQTGAFSLGPVSGTGACPAAAAAPEKAKTKVVKAKQHGRRHV